MLGKLMKYELKSTMKFFAIIWAAILAVALIGGFTLVNRGGVIQSDNYYVMQDFAQTNIDGVFQTIMFLIYAALCTGTVVMSILYIVRRFNKGLLGSEGYLMFTLPVTPRTLITAKGLSAAIIVLISAIVGGISIVLVMMPSISMPGLKQVFAFLGEGIKAHPQAVPAVILGFFIGILVIIEFIYHVYASISIGHLFEKHRMLMAVVAFVAISIAKDIIGTVGVKLIQVTTGVCEGQWNIGIDDPKLIPFILGIMLIQIVWILVYHIISEVILRNRLNLE